MARIVSRNFDKISKLEVVYFEDKFGAKSQVQHPLSVTKERRKQLEDDYLAVLEANEAAVDELTAGGQ